MKQDDEKLAMLSKRLKPCPFCGAKAKLGGAPGWYDTYCTGDGCGARIDMMPTLEEALEIWNRRKGGFP